MLDIRNDIPHTTGYIGRIPVRNIWLLLLYASHLYRELPEAQRVAVEDALDDIPDLVAELLTHAVERRLRRNLSFGYRRRYADLNRVRGRINLLRTERRQLLQLGRVACVYDELTVDTPRNRFVKAALLRLARVVQKPDLARRCRVQAAALERAGVADIPASTHRQARLEIPPGRGDNEDRRMLAAAQLAFDLALPTEDVGTSHFAAPYREERWARDLFEKAVAGFYDVTLSHQGWRVSSGNRIGWPVERQTPGLHAILPSMQTDVMLERPGGQRIIIDTKFTSIIDPGYHRRQSLKSGHIYQMYAYLRSQENDSDPLSLNSTGILLYPEIDDHVDQAAVIQGHEVRFATVDLAADSASIRRRLLAIAQDSPLS